MFALCLKFSHYLKNIFVFTFTQVIADLLLIVSILFRYNEFCGQKVISVCVF